MRDDKACPVEQVAPCPTCRQYSHSIGEDQLAAAHLHFESMYAHPVRGHPMGHCFDDKTRDMAQVLMTAARQRTLPPAAEVERAALERAAAHIEGFLVEGAEFFAGEIRALPLTDAGDAGEKG